MPFAFLIPLLTKWRLYGAIALAVIAVIVMAWFRHLGAENARLKAEVQTARAHVVVEKAQTTLSDTASQTADAAQARALNITVHSEGAARVIQAQPGAETPLPPAVRDAALSAIRELRQQVGSDAGGAGGSGAVVASGALPAS